MRLWGPGRSRRFLRLSPPRLLRQECVLEQQRKAMVARLGPLRAGLHMMARAAAQGGAVQGGAMQGSAAQGGAQGGGAARGSVAGGGAATLRRGTLAGDGAEARVGAVGSGGEASGAVGGAVDGAVGEGGEGGEAEEADAFYSLLRIEGAELPRAAPPPTLRVTLRAYQEQAQRGHTPRAFAHTHTHRGHALCNGHASLA